LSTLSISWTTIVYPLSKWISYSGDGARGNPWIEAFRVRFKQEKGEEKPVRISIQINNSAGIFQLDQLLLKKLSGSGLEPYLEFPHFSGPSRFEEKGVFRW